MPSKDLYLPFPAPRHVTSRGKIEIIRRHSNKQLPEELTPFRPGALLHLTYCSQMFFSQASLIVQGGCSGAGSSSCGRVLLLWLLKDSISAITPLPITPDFLNYFHRHAAISPEDRRADRHTPVTTTLFWIPLSS